MNPQCSISKFALGLALCLSSLAVSAAETGVRTHPHHAFFAFDNGVGRGQWPPVQQAQVLKELGYDGISYNETIDLTNRLTAFRAQGLKIFALDYTAFWTSRCDTSPD